jgi:hypothetical protein
MAMQLSNFHLWNVHKTYLAKETDNYKKKFSDSVIKLYSIFISHLKFMLVFARYNHVYLTEHPGLVLGG